MIENMWKVPRAQWKKWGIAQRHVFNDVMGTMMKNPKLFQHPKAAPVTEPHWKTTAWNAAWMAADALTSK